MSGQAQSNNASPMVPDSNKLLPLFEMMALFFVALIIIMIGLPLAGENPVMRQAVVWVANVAMLLIIWLSLLRRGQNWTHLGLSFKNINLRSLLLSLPVFLAAMFAFVIGSIIMANITGIPESADMSGYEYLQGNLPMLLLALIGVFIVSSFGEEVIYRGFLITRISEIGGNAKYSIKTAVVISAVIFGLVHYEWGPMGIVQTGFMGLALGISFLIFKRNLWILIFAHAYMDAILMVQMYFGGN